MQSRRTALAVCLGAVLMFASQGAWAQYQLINLVSNQVKGAIHDDPLIVNAWGMDRSPTGPFWVADNQSGWSTLYTGTGVKQGLVVAIPTASGANPGMATGLVYNASSTDFQAQGWASFFLFDTLDGTISAWAPGANPNSAIVVVNNSASKASYTGLAITSNASNNVLFAADNANNKVDMYDGSFNLIGSFTDTTLPAGFAPFGIRDISGFVYVTFASTSGASGGYVDIFSEKGVMLKQLVINGKLNQPWGLAAAPANFGPLGGTLLVSNNTNEGTINAFDGINGNFIGTVKDTNGNVIRIDQLWAIDFGGGTSENGSLNQLFFTAGPANNVAGTFGVIVLK